MLAFYFSFWQENLVLGLHLHFFLFGNIIWVSIVPYEFIEFFFFLYIYIDSWG